MIEIHEYPSRIVNTEKMNNLKTEIGEIKNGSYVNLLCTRFIGKYLNGNSFFLHVQLHLDLNSGFGSHSK